MKELKFEKKLEEEGYHNGQHIIDLCYCADQNGEVLFDYDYLDYQINNLKNKIKEILK